MTRFFFIITAFCLFTNCAFGQEQLVTGQVRDISSDEPVPYANVYVTSKTTIGTTTNFEGFFELTVPSSADSISVSLMGYEKQTKAIGDAKKVKLKFNLKPKSYDMKEIVVGPKKAPSIRILEKLWERKPQHDKRSLESYEYQSYAKTEISVDNISEDFKNKAYMKPFKHILDSMQIKDKEEGKDILPVFVSETLSNIYQTNNPERKKERIKASNITGVGLEDGSFISQFVGASFQEYNFYENWLSILNKNFASPIGSNGTNFYEYNLIDTVPIKDYNCYVIQYQPKREQDLAFSGKLWITDSTYALKRIIATTTGNTNINFVDRFRIQQSLEPTEAKPWLPVKTRVLIDIAEVTKKSFGMLGKFYASNKNFKINNPYQPGFYEDDVVKDPGYQEKDPKFWDSSRHVQFTDHEKLVYKTVDSIRNLPIVQSYVDIVETVVNGYWDLGKVEVGPYLLLYGNNVVEGHRFRVGTKTNSQFSENWTFQGHLAYGTKDQRFKYNVQAERFLSRDNWTKVGFQRKKDLEGLGVYDDFFETNNLFQASSQIGLIDRFNMVRQNRFWVQTDLFDGFTQRAFLMTKAFSPEGDYVFSYYNPNNNDTKSDHFQTTEMAFESRFAPKEKTIINGNERVSLRSEKAPVITLRYTMGIRNFLEGDFDYHKASLNLNQDLNLGPLGRGHYDITGTKIFNTIPYPILNILNGNETFIRSSNTYNLMNFYEFVTDESVEVSYTQHFDGFILNRVPLLKKLRWRLVGEANVAFGQLNDANRDLIPNENQEKEQVTKDFKTLSYEKPYVEVAYGIENILRFIRIDAIHRLTYKGGDQVNDFGVKGSLYFSF